MHCCYFPIRCIQSIPAHPGAKIEAALPKMASQLAVLDSTVASTGYLAGG
jgi:hypothetical protein